MRIIISIFTFLLILILSLIIYFSVSVKTDVVIIGAGSAGMQAALACHAETDSLIILEKMPYPGGNSTKASGGINAAQSAEDFALFREDTMAAGNYRGQQKLIDIMIEGSREILSGLIDLGAGLSDKGLLAGHSKARSYRPSDGSYVGMKITNVLFREVEKRGIDVRLENRALKIESAGSRFNVRVENRTGRVYTIRAKAVVIASGGFGGNTEMVVKYNPSLKTLNTTNSPGTSGDFVPLTEELPVNIINMEDIQIHPTVEPDFGILISEALRGNGSILLNSLGERFTDEMSFRKQLSGDILAQKDGLAWLIFDRNIRQSLPTSELYFNLSLVQEAETPELLALKLGIPPVQTGETLALWNNFAEGGEDRQFNRRSLIRPINEPPYYAIKVTPGIHYCMGGLAIDERARVLDKQDKPVPGLYAAGEATGGIHGEDRLGGNSLTDAMVFGRIAGREAAVWASGRENL